MLNSHSDMAERARKMFGDAARRAVVPLSQNEVNEFLQRIWLTLDNGTKTAAILKELTSQLDLRPSNAAATQLAVRIRQFLGVGDIDPLFHLPSLLDERLNVFLFPIEQSKLNGAAALFEDVAFIFVPDVNPEESLFTCAHELAHLAILSARRNSDGGAILDPSFDSPGSLRGPLEYFADVFASELLIPSHGLGVALQKVRDTLGILIGSVGDVELLYLSRIFGVSFLSIAKKCESARILPKGGARSLNRFLIEKFGGPEQRARDLGLPPRPIVSVAPVPKSLELEIIKQINYTKMTLERALFAST